MTSMAFMIDCARQLSAVQRTIPSCISEADLLGIVEAL
jgi:hypothetical protein